MPCSFDTPCAGRPYVEIVAMLADPLNLTGAHLFRCQTLTCTREKWIHPAGEPARTVAAGAPKGVGSSRRRPSIPVRRQLTAEERDLSLDRRHAAKDRALAGIGKR